jgi:hypothetical protein
METTVTSNKPDTKSGYTNIYREEKSGYFIIKLIKCCIGFIMFEWLAGQTIIDGMGLNTLDTFIIGLAFFLLYLIMAIRFREELVESMFV